MRVPSQMSKPVTIETATVSVLSVSAGSIVEALTMAVVMMIPGAPGLTVAS